MISLENVLSVDSDRGAHGLQLVQLFFQELCDNAFKTFMEGSSGQIEVNGLFMVICALYKTCNSPEYLLTMFKSVSSTLSAMVSHTLINVLKQLLERAASAALGDTDQASLNTTPTSTSAEFAQIDAMNIE